ncbi:N-acetylneuraminate synthase [Lewinella marina]|uniref:Pseudaminic acid synthase n=1 Tax=Neolewinella marina TaxID=438751 RepID=A0A2G0CC12_9BACT|nr:pseudaminic acid synthase [Neolewinella marina]NJB86659.1 N-acetylneuraminate synthase [Neolewinella marina]PHK97467.1 pseudaminic acid synthase [Neolewinella marina]
MKEFKIGRFNIGTNAAPFIIAEMSGNHNQSLDRALELVEAAAEAGAHALKLQTYTADTITIDHRGGLFDIQDKDSLWSGQNLYDLYKEAHTPWEWHGPIFDRAKELGMVAFSSPFDETAVDFLEDLNVPAYKIASFESAHHPLLRKVAATGKPVIISSGASRLDELYESVRVLREAGATQICVLKCTSTYPATPENTNLRTIPVLQDIFSDCKVGLSDHTMGIGVSVAAVALGASVIEKHFTLRRADGGVDSAFSLEPQELKALVTETERAWQGLGHIQLDTQKAEKKSRQFKRSIYVVKDIAPGETFTPENLRVIRPGDGLAPKHYDELMGKKATVAMQRGTPFTGLF